MAVYLAFTQTHIKGLHILAGARENSLSKLRILEDGLRRILAKLFAIVPCICSLLRTDKYAGGYRGGQRWRIPAIFQADNNGNVGSVDILGERPIEGYVRA